MVWRNAWWGRDERKRSLCPGGLPVGVLGTPVLSPALFLPPTEHPPPSPDSPVDPEAASVEPVPAASRKQNWARFSCGGRDERQLLPPKAAPDPADAGKPDPAASSPRPGIEQPSEEDVEPAEEAEAVNGSGELGGLSRSPGHGAYLQSLERSSRHWVLSSVKGPGLDEPGGGAEVDAGTAGSEGEIWYNPIPEDEDPQPGSSWKTWSGGSRDIERGHGGESPPKTGREDPPRGSLGMAESSGPRSGTASALSTAGRGEESGASRTQACGEGQHVTTGQGEVGQWWPPVPQSPCPPVTPPGECPLDMVLSPSAVPCGLCPFSVPHEVSWTLWSLNLIVPVPGVPCTPWSPDPMVRVPGPHGPCPLGQHHPDPLVPIPSLSPGQWFLSLPRRDLTIPVPKDVSWTLQSPSLPHPPGDRSPDPTVPDPPQGSVPQTL